MTPKDYTEGPFMLVKDGKYYFIKNFLFKNLIDKNSYAYRKNKSNFETTFINPNRNMAIIVIWSNSTKACFNSLGAGWFNIFYHSC